MSIPNLNIVNTPPRAAPRLFLTSMSGTSSSENPTEMIEPIYNLLDGVIWVLNDVPVDSPSARYLESVKGAGKIIHRCWSRGRHHHCMNDSLYCGPMEEGDFYLYCDDLERPAREFVSRIKTEIIPMMDESDLDVIAYFGKPYLIRYRETLEYRNSPHWSLHGWNGRGIEWNTIENNERLVRLNVRPEKRKNEPYHWVRHYAKYMIEYPAGCNHAALGIEQYAEPGEDLNHAFARREAARLEFRREVRRRGYPVTLDGVKSMLLNETELDDKMVVMLNSEKVLSDYYHFLHGCNDQLKDTHRPSDALPVK